ncbi:HAD family hydrolase [Paenibacillus sp.]|uniref:HAD family hydrolase n=1 Tax=Paenibacillus sp. TaxID=58172 RepID=UPI002D69C63C|nr:HAD family hydrolase [Paenibacillus sp.]HZG83529.1 HAD family hydrolase [Paenibacillus sp.]
MAGGRKGAQARSDEAVCFDLSDTIIEWEGAYEAALRVTLKEWVGRWSDSEAAAAAIGDAIRRYRRARRAGKRRADAVRDAAAAMPIDGDERTMLFIVRQCRRLQTERAGFVDGAEETMRRLAARYRLAIVTNLPAEDAAAIFSRLRLHRFVPESRLFAAATDGGARKPDPRLFRRIAEKLEVPPQRCVMVGDSFRHDVEGALRAGWKAVWIRRKAGSAPLRRGPSRSLSFVPSRSPNRIRTASSLTALPRLLRTLLAAE